MADSNLIISARQPFLQPDGTMQPSWFRFLEALSQQADAQYSTSDVLIDAKTDDNDVSTIEVKVTDALLLSWLND